MRLPGHPRRLLCGLLALALLAAAAFVVARRRPAPLPPMEISLWYWHQPFRLEPTETARLKTLGIRQLFVRAGTLRRAGNAARLTLPQAWEDSANDLQICLVFNFGYDVVRGFEGMANEPLAAAVSRTLRAECERARRAGLRVSGCQLDFDCPTRLLPKYADLLRRLKQATRNAGTLSITALPTWFTSREIETVMDAVDFTVPQYYEAEVPKTLDRYATVSRLALLERGLRAAGRAGRPFYAGLPAYGHALVYDPHGRLLGPYHDMGVRDAARSPALRLARAFPADAGGRPAARGDWTGEDIVDFAADTPSADSRDRGCLLRYDLPTPALVARHLALVRAQRPANCRGVVLFRYPEPGESGTLPFDSLAAAIRGEEARPDLRVRLQAAASPWEIIETGRPARRSPLDLSVTVTNTGTAGTFVAPGAVTVTLCLDRPGVEEIRLRHFDTVETFLARQTPAADLLRSSPRRAGMLRFRRLSLAAGETAKIGPLRLPADGATRVWGAWSALGPGGFETLRGDIPPTSLTGSAR